MRRWLLASGLGMAVLSAVTHAHHSIAGVYDGSRQVTVEGVVTEFQFINPHPFVLMDVADRNGKAQPWRLEMDNRWELVEVGFTAGTLRQGDRLVVIGSLARSQPNSLYIRRLDRPVDGFRYEQAGSRPRVTRGAP